MKEVCADAGYGSEENYEFMERFDISTYVKYNYFMWSRLRNGKEISPNKRICIYNESDDYFVCPMRQHMELAYKTKTINDNGYESEISVYRAINCKGCPLRNKSQRERK